MELAAPPWERILAPTAVPSPLALHAVLLLTTTDGVAIRKLPLIIEVKLSWGHPVGQALCQNP